MRIEGCELLRVLVPFRTEFAHARARRTATDTVFLLLRDECGRVGIGEVLARPYVTGETPDGVFSEAGPALGERLLGASFQTQEALLNWVDRELEDERVGPALLGAAELALLGLLEQSVGVDYVALLGPRRTQPPGRCITIGFEVPTAAIRRTILQAVFGGATAVKMKVGGSEDAERLHEAAARLSSRIALRIDANGELTFDAALALLGACRHLAIASLEQPLPAQDPDLREKLQALHGATRVPLMADESVCRLTEAEYWAKSGAYQLFNIRVGKCGGLRACTRMLEIAAGNRVGAVAGTMVGESALLDRASRLLLDHRAELPYVEGLGQHTTLLHFQPTAASPDDAGALGGFRVTPEARAAHTAGSIVLGSASPAELRPLL